MFFQEALSELENAMTARDVDQLTSLINAVQHLSTTQQPSMLQEAMELRSNLKVDSLLPCMPCDV